MKLIAIDNGHGLNTPGKRTPVMPDGRIIKEWEFNHPTAQKLGEELKRCGFDVLYVSDTKEDTPLKIRTDRANGSNADLFVSIHYNALNGVWGSHGGIETFYYPGATEGKRLAQLTQDHLIKETGSKNRGIKEANFHVLRTTKMLAILVECGFMDNLEEAKRMLNEKHQMNCAVGVAKGICEYFGVAYVPPKAKEEGLQTGKIKINIHGHQKEIEGFKKDGINYVPIRFLEQLGYKIDWNKGMETVLIDYAKEVK